MQKDPFIAGRTPTDPKQVIVGLSRIPREVVAEIHLRTAGAGTHQLERCSARRYCVLDRDSPEAPRRPATPRANSISRSTENPGLGSSIPNIRAASAGIVPGTV